MKTRLLAALLTLCMLLTMAPAMLAAEPATLYVDAASTAEQPDGTQENAYKTIADAIEAASSGDTVYIKDGIYRESVVIGAGKNLTLEGESQDGTVIQFDLASKNDTATYNGMARYPIVYSESDLTLRNLTVAGPTAQHHGISGILAKAGLVMERVTVRDIRCTADGQYVCGVTTYGHGIMIEGTGSASITDCTIKDFQKNAVDINTTGAVVLERNEIIGVGAQQIIAQNGIVARDGKITATGNLISGLSYTADNEWKYASTGIYPLAGVDELTLTQNTLDAVDSPIYTDEVDEAVLQAATIEGNTVTNRVLGVQMGDAWYATVEEAVKAAEAGAVIRIYPGDYNIQQDNITVVSGETGWYLPVDKSVTLMGVDEDGNEITDAAQTKANLYSTDYSANGAWATQNLITVFADNVTISGLTIMNKIDANKALEVVAGADNFVIKNCTFAPIAEDLLAGLDAGELGGYTYDEYKDFGASLYFDGDMTATVENNYFDRSNITFDGTAAAEITVSNNVFEGIKCWNNDPNYTYSSIGYTTWDNPPITDISGAGLDIQKNQFIDAGKVNFSKVTAGQVDLSANYWEDMDLTQAIVGGENDAVQVSTIYTDKEMTQLLEVSVGGETLQEKIDAAQPGAVIDLEGKYWPGNLSVDKALTLKNGKVDTVTAVGAIDGLAFEHLTFLGASTEKNLDTTPTALYLQGSPDVMKNVLVDTCVFQGPASDQVTMAITTLNVENLTVKNSTIDGYTVSAYHNPGQGGNIKYEDNTIRNVKSGIGFIATTGVTITGNTFENANGIRLEDNWGAGDMCTDVNITDNKFLSVSEDDTYGQYAVRTVNSTGAAGYEGELALDHNYWGSSEPDFDQLIVTGDGQNITIEQEPYYVNESMTKLNTRSNVSIGGGAGTADEYSITVNKGENGTVSVGNSTAEEGSTVVISVTPDKGYSLSKLTVTGKDGSALTLTDKGNGQYTFTMPASEVEIAAAFVPEGGIPAEDLPFADVHQNDWFYDAVQFVYGEGMMNGTAENLFSPEQTTTRGMIVTILYRLEGEPDAEGNPFADVAENAYYKDAISWAAANHIAGGYGNGRFGPDDSITREQLAAILYRYADYKGIDTAASGDLSAFADGSSASEWAAAALAWAVEKGVMNGKGSGVLDPAGTAIRAESAQMLMNFCEKVMK